MKINVGKFEFDSDLKHKVYECETYYGVSFYYEDETYDIIDNKYLGYRLIITDNYFCWKDIPFKKETFHFLPSCIKVIEK